MQLRSGMEQILSVKFHTYRINGPANSYIVFTSTCRSYVNATGYTTASTGIVYVNLLNYGYWELAPSDSTPWNLYYSYVQSIITLANI